MSPMQRSFVHLVGILACAGLTRGLAAQSSSGDSAQAPSAASAPATITTATLAHYLDVLSADSLRQRSAPSPALERTAEYVAAQFRHFGLDSTRILHYPIPGQLMLDVSATQLVFSVDMVGPTGGAILNETGEPLTRFAMGAFDSMAYFAPAVGAPVLAQPKSVRFIAGSRFKLGLGWDGSNKAVLLTGKQNPAQLPLATVHDAVVFYCPFGDTDTVTQNQILRQLYTASAGVVLVSQATPPAFAAAQQHAKMSSPVPVVDQYMRRAGGEQGWPWAVVAKAAKLPSLFWATGVDLAQQCADPAPAARVLPTTDSRLAPGTKAVDPPVQAPLVVGIIPGTDSAFRNDYIVITAPMDVDTAARSSDPASRGAARAEDAGLAGLLALAEALSRPEARPRRSVLLLATSGSAGTKKAWGSNAFMTFEMAGAATDRMAGLLSLDFRGRIAGDSIWVDGLTDVDLAQPPAWVASGHPDLRLAVAEGGTVVQPTGDHYPFTLQGIPSLVLHTYSGDSTTTAPATPAAVARVVEFSFYLSQVMATDLRKPRWTTEGRRRLSALRVP